MKRPSNVPKNGQAAHTLHSSTLTWPIVYMHSWAYHGDALRIYPAHGEQFSSHTMQNDPCLHPQEAHRETRITNTAMSLYNAYRASVG